MTSEPAATAAKVGPVFVDSTGRRSRRCLTIARMLGAAVTAFIVAVCAVFFTGQRTPMPQLTWSGQTSAAAVTFAPAPVSVGVRP